MPPKTHPGLCASRDDVKPSSKILPYCREYSPLQDSYLFGNLQKSGEFSQGAGSLDSEVCGWVQYEAISPCSKPVSCATFTPFPPGLCSCYLVESVTEWGWEDALHSVCFQGWPGRQEASTVALSHRRPCCTIHPEQPRILPPQLAAAASAQAPGRGLRELVLVSGAGGGGQEERGSA